MDIVLFLIFEFHLYAKCPLVIVKSAGNNPEPSPIIKDYLILAIHGNHRPLLHSITDTTAITLNPQLGSSN